ncbi:MAG TPA: PilW family protein [Sideroxyarcus sp.]|nr:PilW family protein [Sideroxyarcus sp.]
MKSANQTLVSRQSGFTLVEIMVGLVIGLLATIIIMQVFSVFEAQKRTTTGTADAQTNGGIALYTITRELQQAGFPLVAGEPNLPNVPDSALECTTLTFGATGITSVAPAVLTDSVVGTGATDSSSDTITIHYGSSLSGGVPTKIQDQPVGTLTGTTVPVINSLGCANNDIAMIINGATCAMTTVSGVTNATTIEMLDDSALVAGAAVDGAKLSCLGTWNEVTYAVNNGNLERNGTPSVAGVVNLQAQYGISANANSNQITGWVNPTGAWAAPTVANRNRIKAIRIAVVARNAKMEMADVTTACSSLTASAPTGLCAWAGSASSPAPAVTLSAPPIGDPNWQRYRYRVFETIIPLRNVIWAKGTL